MSLLEAYIGCMVVVITVAVPPLIYALLYEKISGTVPMWSFAVVVFMWVPFAALKVFPPAMRVIGFDI